MTLHDMAQGIQALATYQTDLSPAVRAPSLSSPLEGGEESSRIL